MAESCEPTADMEVCASYLKALGDPVRLQVVRALRAGPLSVSDIALLLDMDITNVSHHLRVLYHAKLVTSARDGKFIYYKLNSDFLTGRAAKKSLDFGCCQINLPT
jgi:DNA-binding transcriptional ArsR family regulator